MLGAVRTENGLDAKSPAGRHREGYAIRASGPCSKGFDFSHISERTGLALANDDLCTTRIAEDGLENRRGRRVYIESGFNWARA